MHCKMKIETPLAGVASFKCSQHNIIRPLLNPHDNDDQSWVIGTWDRYSGIPVLPEVKISTYYLNTDLFKKILNT